MSRQSRPQEPSTGSLRRRAGQATLATEVSWALTHVHLLEKALGTADVTDIARRHDVPPDVLRPGIRDIADAGWLVLDGTRVTLTPAGRVELDLLRKAWRRWLDGKLGERGLDPRANRDRVDRALDRIAHDLMAGQTPELTSAGGAQRPSA